MDKATQTMVTPEFVAQLATTYQNPRQAVIRPEVVMGVPRYFLERWVPVLGPSSATLVNTLRQLVYHHPKKPITINGERLAAEAAMSRRHLYKCLKSPWVGVFVQVQSGKKIKRQGRTTRPPNRYTVRAEDPLTPADAQQLLDYLREAADSPIDAIRKALEEPPRNLWAASPLTPTPTRFAMPKPIFAAEVVRYAFPDWKAANDEERAVYKALCQALHQHMTLVRSDGRVSKVIVPQYFRQRWWPLLGHDLAWAYLWLRGRTFENISTGARRESCWVPSLNTILEVIGRPREWWRRNVDHARDQGEGWSLAAFFHQTETQKGRDPNHPQKVARRFTVHLEIPVAPEDRPYYTGLKSHWPERPAQPQPSQPAWSDKTASQASYADTTGHIHAQNEVEGAPHLETMRVPVTATTVHNATASSATAVHKAVPHPRTGSKHPQKAPQKTKSHSSSSSSNTRTPPTLAEPERPPNAAAKNENDIQVQKVYLSDLISQALLETPEVPFYQVAPLRVWMEQGPRLPVAHHSPAWNNIISGKVSPRDAVALILGLWFDASITRQPQHLSWLTKFLAIEHTTPPVVYWEQLQELAELPIGEWPQKGLQMWRRMMQGQKYYRRLPWHMEEIFREVAQGGYFVAGEGMENTGLNERPGGGRFTAYGVWQVAMRRIKERIGESAYHAWIAECDAVYYTNDELYICAIDGETVQVLENHYRELIEEVVRGVAQYPPLRVRFVEENVPADDETEAAGGAGGQSDALSAPDSSRSARPRSVASMA